MSGGQHTRAPSILVVDDEPALRSALAFDFELRDFRVFEAEHGKHAMEILEKVGDIDVVLTDVLMPVMGGVELLEGIRSAKFEQPGVVFLTGYSELTLEVAHDRGADAFFGKPFDRDTLIRTVDRLVLPPRERWKSPSPPGAGARRLVHAKVDSFASENAGFRLGHGGFFLSSDLAPGLHVRQELEIRIELDSLALEGVGRVVWSRTPAKNSELPAGAGVEWLSLSDRSMKVLLDELDIERLRPYIPLA